jgi:hypothetical protein
MAIKIAMLFGAGICVLSKKMSEHCFALFTNQE